MAPALFAGLFVADHEAVVGWYSRLFGAEPSFAGSDTESVWQLADDRWVYVQQNPRHAGHGALMVLVDDLEGTLTGIAGQGLGPERREDDPGGMQKAVFADADGNEVGVGGVVASPPRPA